jgi:predicted O-linked N-acetylglucosamine transferase (SPINDLY family)
MHELGLLFHQMGNSQRSIALLTRAAQLRPGDFRFQYNLAVVLRLRGHLPDAIECFRRAMRLQGETAQTLNVVGECLRESGHLSESLATLERALQLLPQFAPSYNNIGCALQEQGKTDQAIAVFRKTMQLDPRNAGAHSNLLLCLNYSDRATPARLHAPASAPTMPLHPRAPDGRIRIGYLSPDLRQHSVAFFFWPILKAHDRSRFNVTCYADVAQPDVITRHMQTLCDRWRVTAGVSDDQLARLVADDQIDILIELAGHTAHNRLPLLGRRIAPIQVSYLGYPNTTGLASMDYRITDAASDPPGSESLYSERLVRLPGAFFTYLGLTGVPDVSELPAARSGEVTFGVFCNFAKVQPAMLRCWAHVLHAVPRSRLLVHARSLTDEQTRLFTQRSFARLGVNPNRLELRGWLDFPVYVKRFNRVDIVLDTFPFGGHTTTCHALWMGEPVITLAGQTHRSRLGASILTHNGLAELVAYSEESFARIATGLARDLPRLASLRASLRDRTRQNLCSTSVFTRGLESAYTDMIANRA